MSNKARRGRPTRSVVREPARKPRRQVGTEHAAEPFGSAVQQWLIIAVAVGVQFVVLTKAADAVNVPKLTWLLVITIAIAAISVVRIATERTIVLPRAPAVYAAAAFAVSAVIAVAVAPATGVALWGDYLRNAGLFMYLACLVLFVIVVRVSDGAFLRRLALSLVAVGGLLSLYTIFQRAGADPVPWQQAYSAPVSTFGNPDFAGACYSILLPFAVWAAVWARLDVRWRVACGAAAALLFAGDVISGAAQGFVGAAAGLFVLLLGWILTQRDEMRRRGVVAWFVLAGFGTLGLAIGMSGVGPFAGLGGVGALSIRRRFWDVAVTMFGHHPFVGVGLSMYGHFFRYYRSEGVVHALGAVDAPDEPHNVALAMFANGGLLLGLSYLAFILAVAIALIRALRRSDTRTVPLIAAYGGAWIAYQVQSMVSVDVVPLAVLHFVLSGAIVGVGGVRYWNRRLGPPAAPRRRTVGIARQTPHVPAVVLTAVAGVVLAWFAIQPLRADIHLSDAAKAMANGESQTALHDLQQATSEASWQGVYWLQRSKADGAVGNIQQGLADLRRALSADPRDVDAASSLARVELALRDYPAAIDYFRVAIRLDPRNPSLQEGLVEARVKQAAVAQS